MTHSAVANQEKEKARAIVEAILKEIESRILQQKPDPSLFRSLTNKMREMEVAVLQECSTEIPKKYLLRIKECLGPEILDTFESGKIGALFKGRERNLQVLARLAVWVEQFFYAKDAIFENLLEVARLQEIQKELIQSQVEHVSELELLEEQRNRAKMLLSITLDPFEIAIKKILDFLKVSQMEIFLLDDDKFLATELKTDGRTFTYNKEEKQSLPLAINELQLREIQETILEMPLIVEGTQIGQFKILRRIEEDFDKELWKKDVAWIAPFIARVIESNRNRILARKINIDDLTQLNNKRKLNEQMSKLFLQFKQGQKKLFLAMMDIDKFKKLNDTYGHPVGDEILKKTSAIIKEGVPNAYRYGGEEFLAVFYGYDKDSTMKVMEDLRQKIESNAYEIAGNIYKITISSGVAEFETHMNSVKEAIERADQALYASKEDGRNRCTYYDDIKDRLLADQNRMRQEVLQLKEKLALLQELEKENRQLRKQLGIPTRK